MYSDTKITHWFLFDLIFTVVAAVFYLFNYLWGTTVFAFSAITIICLIVFIIASLAPGIPSGIQSYCRYTLIKFLVLFILLGTYFLLIK